MKIIVKYNNSYYYWVDTVTMHDEYDYICAVLVSSKGAAFPVCLDKIEVVDDSYNYETQIRRQIDALEYESSQLKSQMELNAKLKGLKGL
jgi:hypothetical protein